MRIFRKKYRDPATGLLKQTKNFMVELKDHRGMLRRFAVSPDRTVAHQVGNNISRLAKLKESGFPISAELQRWLEDVPQELLDRLIAIGLVDRRPASLARPLLSHLDDWQVSMEVKGDTRTHALKHCHRVQRVFQTCRFVYWRDIEGSRVEATIAAMTAKDGGMATATANHYIGACKAFCSWMVSEGRATESPLERLGKRRVVSTDRVLVRRPLSAAEVRTLLAATEAAETRYGMEGQERSILYRFAIETGLRAGEIASLTVGSFDFATLTVTVADAYTKNRRETTLPLRPDTASLLKDLFKDKQRGDPAFDLPHKCSLPRMLRKDLQAAGIPFEDDDGRRVDFHALRVTTASLMAAAGEHPKMAQELLRHSDINLTMRVYTHSYRGQLADVVNRMPDFSPRQKGQDETKAG